jgi:hypothetical protein
LEYFSDDTPNEQAYKDQVVAFYLNRQDDRIERKKFVIDRDFLVTSAKDTGNAPMLRGSTMNKRDE